MCFNYLGVVVVNSLRVISTMSTRSQANDYEPVSKLQKTTPEVPVCKIAIPYHIIMSCCRYCLYIWGL